MHTTRQHRALARHEQAPGPCLRSACHRPAPARQRSTRRQRRALLQGQPARRCLAALRLRARASRRSQGHRRARRACADRAAARRAAWPWCEQSAAALAAHRHAPWGAVGAEEGAQSVATALCGAPRGAGSSVTRAPPLRGPPPACFATRPLLGASRLASSERFQPTNDISTYLNGFPGSRRVEVTCGMDELVACLVVDRTEVIP